MARIFPFSIMFLQQVRKLNGVIPIHGHPMGITNALNALVGYEMRGNPIIVPLDDYITTVADMLIPVPLWNPKFDRYKVDVLGYAAVGGAFNVDVTSGNDATGVRVTFRNWVNGATSTIPRASWETGGWGTGDSGSGGVPTRRTIKMVADAEGFDYVTFTGSVAVKVWALAFTPVHRASMT